MISSLPGIPRLKALAYLSVAAASIYFAWAYTEAIEDRESLLSKAESLTTELQNSEAELGSLYADMARKDLLNDRREKALTEAVNSYKGSVEESKDAMAELKRRLNRAENRECLDYVLPGDITDSLFRPGQD